MDGGPRALASLIVLLAAAAPALAQEPSPAPVQQVAEDVARIAQDQYRVGAAARLDVARAGVGLARSREGHLAARVGQMVTPGQALLQLVPPQTYVVGQEFEGEVESLSGGTGSAFSRRRTTRRAASSRSCSACPCASAVWARPPRALPSARPST